MKTSFLATVFAPVQFLSLFVLFVLNFILFVHTGHANFGFTDVQYLQNVVFSTETGLNGPNHSSIDFPHPMKKSLTLPNFLPYPPPPPYPTGTRDYSLTPLTLLGKPWHVSPFYHEV